MTKEMLQQVLACDLDRWPFPWTNFDLKALPPEALHDPQQVEEPPVHLWGSSHDGPIDPAMWPSLPLSCNCRIVS